MSETHFDLERLRLSQDFLMGKTARATTDVPVRKPNKQDFIRTHPTESFATMIFEDQNKIQRPQYAVDQKLWLLAELENVLVPKLLVPTMNRARVLTLWPIRVKGDAEQLDTWNESAMEAAEAARENWVRVVANPSKRGYDVFEAKAILDVPEWPKIDWQELIDKAFKNYYIDSADHPMVKALGGQ